MCGLVGYWGIPNQVNLERSLEVISHRGPDGRGSYIDEAADWMVALGHARLSILDTGPRSDQPFHYNGNVLCFNGEIYNYLEIREELRALGHEFKTNGDTEVLAHLLDEWGEAGLSRAEGMWAFAWFKGLEKELVLSRDRFGEKPLHIFKTSTGVYFSSEIKGIRSLLGKSLNVNGAQISRYLVNGYKALYKKNESFFDGIIQIEPGTTCVIDSNNNERITRYWSYQDMETLDLPYQHFVDGVRERIIDAVKIRLRSDVPLAFCMSGGVDSNSLISIAKKVFGYDVHGFTIVNSDARYEEQDLVQVSVSDLGVRHTEIKLTEGDFLSKLRKQITQHDAPIATLSYFVHEQLLQAMANEGYKVSISGTGADEIFTGYYDHHNFYLAEIGERSPLFVSSLENWEKYQRPIVRNPFLKNPRLILDNPQFRDHIYLNSEKFSNFLKEGFTEAFSEELITPKPLRNRMLNELFHEVVPVILNEDDLNSMSHSIENRSPFLDSRLFEYLLCVPTEFLMRDGLTKALLRDSMRDLLPEKVGYNRRKVGFNAPIEDLLDLKLENNRAAILDDGPVFDYIKKDSIEALLRSKSLTNSYSKFLFNFLNVKLFLESQASL